MGNYRFAKVPSTGECITYENGQLGVPDNPIIPFVEGDGTGPDIWRAAVRVFDAAMEKAYGGARRVAWPGWKCSPGRRRSATAAIGYPRRRSTRWRSSASASRDR